MKEMYSSKLSLVALLIGVALAFTVLNSLFAPGKTNFEASATMGTQAKPVFSSVNGFPIHCSGGLDIDKCLTGLRSRGAIQSALWLGNSQVHEVNNWKSGEVSAPALLFEKLRKNDLDLLTFSFGNANLQEHYVLFEYLRSRMPLKLLILPVVFDDTREEGLRSDIANLVSDAQTARSLSKTEIGKRLVTSIQTGANRDIVSTDNNVAGNTDTLQQRSETKLNGWLEENSRLWQSRPEIRGWLLIELYKWRNYVFGITPATTRKVIPGRYRENLSAFEAILESANKEGIRVVVYVAPLRGGVKIPYDPSEYLAFKAEVAKLANRYGAVFENLEKIVPNDFWGTKASTSISQEQELDFMHFRFSGHEVLANNLRKLAIKALAD
jgi:hypothetical protein